MTKASKKAVSSILSKVQKVDLNTNDFQSLYLDTYSRAYNLLGSSDLAHKYLFRIITVIVLKAEDIRFKGVLSTVVNGFSGFGRTDVNSSNVFRCLIQPFELEVTAKTGSHELIDLSIPGVEQLLSSFICELIKPAMLRCLISTEGCFCHHALCSAYENVISHLDVEMQKESGSIYTPKGIANYICYEVVNSYVVDKVGVGIDTNLYALSKEKVENLLNCLMTITILEPSMGAGVIFIEMLNYVVGKVIECKNHLKEKSGESALTTGEKLDIHLSVLKNMYGMDINETALKLAKNCILLKLYTLGYNKAEIGFNVFCVDTALKGMPKGVSFATGSNSGFKYDIVVGNPPYLRSKNISDVDKGVVQNYSVYHGNADLLCYFYELGFNLLKDGGVLGYITSNKWLTANYGEPLRAFILDKCELIGILDFKDNRVFKGVGVDTEITFLKKVENLEDRNKDFWYCDGTDYKE